MNAAQREKAFLDGVRSHPEALPLVLQILQVRTQRDLDRLEETAKTADPATAARVLREIATLRASGALPIGE